MTQEELLQQIMQLPLEQKIGLIEAISRDLRAELTARVESNSATAAEAEGTGTQDTAQDKVRLSERLRGIIKFDGPPPTDEEVKDMYADYLLEKYS